MANTEKVTRNYVYYEASGDKRSALQMVISSYNNFGKPDAEGYFPSSYFTVKAFGPKADFIYKNFKPGSAINIVGTLVIEKGREKEDGTGRYPDAYVIYVDNQYFPARSAGEGSGKAVHSESPAAAKPANTKPTKVSLMPF